MRASSVFILYVVLSSFLYFGMGVYGEITGATIPGMVGTTTPFLHWVNYNNTTGSLDINNGANDTSITDVSAWAGTTGIIVSSSSNEVNFASLAYSFITLMIGIVTAPFSFVEISGLATATAGLAYLFPVTLLVMMILAIWQIITGRST